MTTTWGLGREVVLLINLSRASIEAWQMLWHLSSNGSRVWLRNWGKGYMSAERSVQLVSQVGEIKYGNSNSGTFWAATISLGELPHGECIIFARIPVQIALLNEGYHYQTLKFIWGKNRLKYINVQWPWQIPCAISPPPSWVSYPLSVCYGLYVLILVWLLSFNPYAVLVAEQNLLAPWTSLR